MKRMVCQCGQPVFFDNRSCVSCGRTLAFDPAVLDMQSGDDNSMPKCANRGPPVLCNWLPKAGSAGGFCLACAMSKTVPALDNPENHQRWRKLEAAKRRLIYDLLRLELPVDDTRLRFDFKEDRRTNPNVSEHHVSTGHASGVITINAAEADEIFRERMRQQMNEPWRTLVGHFRHESGHHYFGIVVAQEQKPAARALFGDERTDYNASLARYYQDGPPPDWHENFISAYATSHPAEDWAECWAHYLHIRAVLEVASEAGLLRGAGRGSWYGQFIELVLSLNEIMRALGLPDAYPFVIHAAVARKIEFIHRAVAGTLSAEGHQTPGAD